MGGGANDSLAPPFSVMGGAMAPCPPPLGTPLDGKSIENKERLPLFLKKYSRLLRNILTFILPLSRYLKR